MKNQYDQDVVEELPADFSKLKSRVMYIEDKSHGLVGPARIGRVFFSKTGKTLYYGGRKFQSLKGFGFKANYSDVQSGHQFWITGLKKRGGNRLYGGNRGVEIDEDVKDEYLQFVTQ